MNNEKCYRSCIPSKYLLKKNEWERISKFLPQNFEKSKVGRPMSNLEDVLNGIYYLLKTGCQWRSLPNCFGAASTIHDHFQRLVKQDFFYKIWQRELEYYDREVGLKLQTQVSDCTLVRASLGGSKTGLNPFDKHKSATKRSIIVDGNGIPLSIQLEQAQRHDSQILEKTIRSIDHNLRKPPFSTLHLDSAYDSKHLRILLSSLGYFPKIATNRRRSKKSMPRERDSVRWIVERTHSWMNKFRKISIRWEKHAANYCSMLHFACQIIIFNKLGISG